MKTFVEAKPREATVKSLLLDPNNPRLRLYPGGVKEKDIIERLCRLKSQSPSSVVKHMLADRGFINSMIPTVYKAEGSSKLLVIDGNRRVAALKMILDPSLIPSTRHGLKADCEKLRGLVPTKIAYWVTRNKSDAARIVYRAHNDGTREWDSLARYASHYDAYNQNQSIADIADYTGTPSKQIKSEINLWLLMEAMIQHISGFQIDDEGITNFERVTTSYSKLPQTLGFKISPEGVYQLPDSKELAELIYKIYLKSAKSDRGSGGQAFTREVGNNDEAREKFLSKIIPRDFASRPKEIGSQLKLSAQTTNKQENLINSTRSQPEDRSANLTKGTPPLTSDIPSDRQILSFQKNVGKKAFAIMGEYNRILAAGGDFPIACAALTRAMIETTLKHHAKRLKCYNESIEQQQANRSDALDSIANKLKKEILRQKLLFSADLVGSISSCIKAVPDLNDVMHKDGSFAARSTVKTSLACLAAAVENLMKIAPLK